MKEKLRAGLPAFVLVLFVLQPTMDVLSFWMDRLSLPNTLTLLLRFGLLGLTVLLGFVLSDRKPVYWAGAGICLLLFGAHVLACMQEGYSTLVNDLINYVRIVQMPVTVLCLITFFRQNDRSFAAMEEGLMLALLLMLAVDGLSVLTGTDNRAYDNGHGLLGWFNNSNSQSCNLTVLVPMSLAWQLSRKKWNPWLFWATAAAGFGVLYFMCTRLAYLGLVVGTAGLCITILLARRKDWKIAAALGLTCVLAIGVLPVSPLGHHIDNGNRYESGRQDQLEQELGPDKEAILALAARKAAGETLSPAEDARLVEGLAPIYEHYVGDFVETFGLEKTMEMYHYSADIFTFADVRPKKIMFGHALMADSGPLAPWFGLELARFTVGENIYDVENDFHGLYFLYGWAGLGAYVLFLLYFVGLVLWALFKNFRQYFTILAGGTGLGFLMAMAHAVATAGILRRPNASIYLSAILAAIYYLVRLKDYSREAE